MSLPVSSLMQRHVRTADMDATVAQIESLLAEHNLSWLPVVGDQGDVLGVISQSDLTRFRTMLPDLATMRAWQLCTYRPITVSADAPADAVARLMVEHRIHHVVVIENERAAGVVSSLDLLRLLNPADRP
jgi:CBS domain-containing protein